MKPAFGREYHHFEAPYIVFEVMADGFLYNMVEPSWHTLMEIGRGLHLITFMADVIQSMDRNFAARLHRQRVGTLVCGVILNRC